MAISAFDRPAGLPPVDFDFLLKAKAYGDEENKKVNQAYDDAYAEFNKVLAVPGEEGKRNQALKPYVEGMNKWADRYADNPRQGLPELRKLVRDFKQDFNYGQLGAIHSAGKNYADMISQVAKMDQEGKFEGQGKMAAYNVLQKPLEEFLSRGGTQQIAPGVFTKLNLGTPFKYENLQDKAMEIAKGWEKDEVPIMWGPEGKKTRFQDVGRGYFLTGLNKVVPYEEVYGAILNSMKSDPAYREQISHMNNYNEYMLNAANPGVRVTFDTEGNPMKYKETMTPEGPVWEYTDPRFGSDVTNEQLGMMAKTAANKYSYEREEDKYLFDKLAAEERKAARKAIEKKPDILPPDPVTESLLNLSASPQGISTANIDVVAPLLGVTAYDPKKNFVKVSLTGRPVLFEFGTTGDPDKDLNNGALVMAYSRLKDIRNQAETRLNTGYTDAQLAAIAPKLLNDPKKPYDPMSNPVIYKPAGEELGFFGPTGELQFVRKDGGPSILIDKKDFTSKAVKYQPGYQEFADKFLTDYGVNVNDPTFDAQVNKVLADPKKKDKQKEKLALGLMEKLSNVKFVPSADATLKAGNNKKAYVSGTAEVTADEFRGLFGKDAEDMEEYGLENGVLQVGEKDSEGKIKKYLIKMNVPVSRTGPEATESHWFKKESGKERSYVNYQVDVAQRAAGVMGYAAPAQQLFQKDIEVNNNAQKVLNDLNAAIDAGGGTPEQKAKAKESAQTIISNISRADATGNSVVKLQNYGFLGELANIYGLLK